LENERDHLATVLEVTQDEFMELHEIWTKKEPVLKKLKGDLKQRSDESKKHENDRRHHQIEIEQLKQGHEKQIKQINQEHEKQLRNIKQELERSREETRRLTSPSTHQTPNHFLGNFQSPTNFDYQDVGQYPQTPSSFNNHPQVQQQYFRGRGNGFQARGMGRPQIPQYCPNCQQYDPNCVCFNF
jgi:hypothetical protein